MSGKPTYEEALQFMADAMLYQRIDLAGPWQGWRIRGQYLVSPDNERIMMRELIGLLIHYRRKFGHKRSAGMKAAALTSSNVVPFVRASVVQPAVRKHVA